ncbi:hypothetical protein LBMAG27_04950 [Bacteroidota bacterium]|nr:hypothetical protein LBMAG27_04950 [Bacteroidota bacterium]
MPVSKRLKLILSPAVAVNLKLKFRAVTITYISIAILVAMRVFSLGIFGTPFSTSGSSKAKKSETSSSVLKFLKISPDSLFNQPVKYNSCCW